MATNYHLTIDSDEPINLSQVLADLGGSYLDDAVSLVGTTPPPPIPPSDPTNPNPAPTYIPPIGDVWVLIVNGVCVGCYYNAADFQAAIQAQFAYSFLQESGNICIGWAKGEAPIPPMFNAHIQPDFGGRGGGGGVRPTTGLIGGSAPGPFPTPTPPPPPPPPPPSYGAMAAESAPEKPSGGRFRDDYTDSVMRRFGLTRGAVTEAILCVERYSGASIDEIAKGHGIVFLDRAIRARLPK